MLNKVRDAFDDYPRFPGSRSGGDQQSATGVVDDRALLLRELERWFGVHRGRIAGSANDATCVAKRIRIMRDPPNVWSVVSADGVTAGSSWLEVKVVRLSTSQSRARNDENQTEHGDSHNCCFPDHLQSYAHYHHQLLCLNVELMRSIDLFVLVCVGCSRDQACSGRICSVAVRGFI